MSVMVGETALLDSATLNKLQKRVETLFKILHGADFKTLSRLLKVVSIQPLTTTQHRHAQADGVDWSVGFLGSIWHDCKLGRIALYEPDVFDAGGAWGVVLCNDV